MYHVAYIVLAGSLFVGKVHDIGARTHKKPLHTYTHTRSPTNIHIYTHTPTHTNLHTQSRCREVVRSRM